ncbi:hypothetical protein QO002_005932 [Pararhizobium capsulatum DSM 1112]|uniref:DUF2188 domain-containing protein n=1 Tax=Pararhizobium capsulatum DSM 1112 TaxID=1121113 RepID=A0ABU0BZR0_9HYPH|nr:hypothetical protein [Pararhizobium capsulatum]MDQ0323725.1 hypothetical protein [Pararhizobium capsulatum DSM 1112]
MGELSVKIKKFQGVWVAKIFHGEAIEHHGFATRKEAEDYGQMRVKVLTDLPIPPMSGLKA